MVCGLWLLLKLEVMTVDYKILGILEFQMEKERILISIIRYMYSRPFTGHEITGY